MSEEDVVGQEASPEESGADESQGEGSGGGTGQPSTATVDTDPRFAGKSAEELKAIIREQDRHIGRQGNALGELQSLKQTVAEMRAYLAQSQRQPERQPEVGVTRGDIPEFDLTNPAPYVAEIASRIINTREQQRMEVERQRVMAEAQANFVEGKEAAVGRRPELFEGIEGDVDRAVQNSFATGIISAAQLRSPKVWEWAAKIVRIERGEDEKIVSARKPVRPVESEKPGRTQAGQDDDEVTLDEQDREEMKRLGLSEKEAKENIRIALNARRRGLQVDRRN